MNKTAFLPPPHQGISQNTLPPRPPVSFSPTRKASASPHSQGSIIPALPMAASPKKVFPPPGIGRGHSSLPPKPGFVGKPLPRETAAIVLTGDGGSFAPSHLKTKRTYSSVASENIMRPMDPAVTNLTPQNRVSPSATNHHGIPHSITPPSESILASKGLPLSQLHNEAHGAGKPRSPIAQKTHPEPTGANGTADKPGNTKTERKMYPPESQPQPVYDAQMPNFPNGMSPQDMYHPMAQQFHHAPHQHPGGFFHPYHSGALTPPPSMGLPGMQPVDSMMFNEMMYNYANGVPGQQPVYPSRYGAYQSPNDPQVHHGKQQFPSPSSGQDHHEHPNAQRSNGPPQAKQPNGAHKKSIRNPRLRGISFVSPDEDNKGIQSPVSSSGQGTPKLPAAQHVLKDEDRQEQQQHATLMSSLESYMTQQFLNERLSDVMLVLVEPKTGNVDRFPAHSFVLGRSEKLYQVLGHPKKHVPSHQSQRSVSRDSWADEMEGDGEQHHAGEPGVTYDGQNITFETSVSRESFLLVLKSLYGGSEWELDAFLDPKHPGYWSAIESVSHTLQNLNVSEDNSGHHTEDQPIPIHAETVSPEVQVLERAFQILSAGVLLGMDDIVYRAIDNIKCRGLAFEGGAFERLMKFLLFDAEELKKDAALSSPHWNFTDHLLHEAIDLFARSIPEEFKLDFRAPTSKYLNRLGGSLSSPPVLATSPGITQHQRIIRQIQSTILISLPFEIMKQILEYGGLGISSRKKLFDLATAVVRERERRRKRESKAYQELMGKDGEEVQGYPEILLCEESVVMSFGHGGVGIEITKRRKGGPGGRLL
jgi:hypothetical protein